ncbi:MAG: hypothetical protein KDJ97_00270 [Anaerolineae bacterium]|nr:hypothetical protein [Anaerolineae bacterium]
MLKSTTVPVAQASDVEFNPNVNPLLLIALLSAIVFHGGLSLYGTYAHTYDAYVHIFFADHWTRSWFDHWDTRWYTGFPLISYPPLSQQSVALVSFVTHDLQLAFAIVQTGAITVMTLGMYRFAKIWVSEEVAGWAAIWLVFSSAMAETIHVFGQLPTTYSLGLLLNALPFAYLWVERSRPSDLVKAWALMAATTGAHHVTTLFGSVFITAPVIVLALLQRFRTPLPDEPASRPKLVDRANWRALIVRRLRRILSPAIRAGVFGVGTIVLLGLVVFPYWYWSKTDPITQVAIPHASRDNFLVNLNAGLVFWLIPYGLLLVTFPYVFYKGLTTKAWPLTASIALLALLGTGGTTPIPRLLLGGAFDILTLDRFTLWASILMLPLAGELVVSLRHGGLARWIDEQFGRVTLRAVQIALAVGLLIAAIFTVSLTQFRRFQPDPIDMQSIVNFINKDEHWRWRYLTLGFGDQMAWLSAQTTAAQVDGNYHSARRLPELTTTPVERLEGAKFRGIPGIGSLQQFLAVPDKFNLKFIYSNDQFYDPLLFFYGWHRLQRLENGVVVWERADIPALPEALPRQEISLYQRWMFGLLPPFALIAAITVTTAPWWGLPLRLLAEFLGLTALLNRLPRPCNTPPQRLWNWIDGRLARLSELPSQESSLYAPWQVWLRYFTMFSLKRMKPASPRARHIRATLLLLALLATAGAAALLLERAAGDPIHVVEAYYDDLDFRRFESAYARLNPNTRPTFDQYLLQLSVQGGLVASYGKLDTLTTTVLSQEPNHLTVQAQAKLITALDYYTDTVTHEMTQVSGQWYIEPPPVDVSQPPGEFLRRPGLDWLAMSTRRIDVEGNDLENSLDRPDLHMLSARLVRDSQGQLSVVGELQNRDTNPSDTTLSATIYDDRGNKLVWYNASEVMLHKLFPQEITPFRVNFEGVAGDTLETAVANVEFNPGQHWAYSLPHTTAIGSFSVFGRGIVTDRDLLRDVAAQNITFIPETDTPTPTLRLRGQLINNGVIEAIVPHLLITLYDADGNVRWVDHHYLRESIRPQRSTSFDIPLTPVADTRLLSVSGNAFPGSADNTQGPRPDFIALPAGFGYAYARLSVHYQPKSE